MKLKLKLALNNVKKNKSLYIPYVLILALTIFLLFSILNLKSNPSLTPVKGFNSISQLLSIAFPIFIFFFTLLIYNVNRFCYQFRSKNFGLYHVLGLTKTDIAHVYFLELSMIFILGFLVSIPVSFILDRGIYQLFIQLIKIEMNFKHVINLQILISVGIIVFLMMLISSISSFKHLLTANSIELLKDESQGEKKPKYNVVIAILGILLLAGAYYFASTIDTNFLKEENIFKLFICIIAVIIATFALFVSSSLWILSLIKKVKPFYFQTKPMIIISNLMFRLKKNAFSLAGIAILSTMAMFVAATTSLFVISLNQQTKLSDSDYMIRVGIDDFNQLNMPEIIQKIENQNQTEEIKLKLDHQYQYARFYSFNDSTHLMLLDNLNRKISSIDSMILLTLEEYNVLTNQNITLNNNETMVFASSFNNFPKDKLDHFKIGDIILTPQQASEIKPFNMDFGYVMILNQTDYDALIQFGQEQRETEALEVKHFGFSFYKNNVRINDSEFAQFDELTNFNVSSDFAYSFINARGSNLRMILAFSGTLFIGTYFVLIFILSLFSLLYFKFYQEALSDQKRFITLQQVGLSPIETKQALNLQITLLFFLPLVVALMHMFFARRGIQMIQLLLGFVDDTLRLNAYLISFSLFILLYLILYTLIKKLVHHLILNNK